MRTLKLILLPILVATLLSACPRGEDMPVEGVVPKHNAAVESLMLDADNAIQAGNYSLAATYLERAARIDPNNAYVWTMLAEVKLAQGQYAQAIQMVTLSESLIGNRDPALNQRNKTIRLQAQQAMGQG